MLGKASGIRTHLASNYIKMADFIIDHPDFIIIDIKFSIATSITGNDLEKFLIIYAYKEESA